jgi:hypothetical protein
MSFGGGVQLEQKMIPQPRQWCRRKNVSKRRWQHAQLVCSWSFCHDGSWKFCSSDEGGAAAAAADAADDDEEDDEDAPSGLVDAVGFAGVAAASFIWDFSHASCFSFAAAAPGFGGCAAPLPPPPLAGCLG